MNLSDTPIANPIIVLREEFDDWAVLFNPDTAGSLGINPMGVAIWKQIDGIRRVDHIIDRVRETYNHVPETVDQEILAFLDTLAQKGFLGLEDKKEA